MTFKENLLQKLENKLTKEQLNLLPSGFQFLGDIIVINLKPELLRYKEEIGNAVLELNPKIRMIANKEGEITGEFREPQLKIIATRDKQDNNTETVLKENNCLYKLDITKNMFAKGNINERVRIAKFVKKNEIVVDMFAGIGYFSIPLGRLSKAKKIFSIELNPKGFHYLKENVKLNKIKNIEVISGDNKKIIPELVKKGIKADRIIMGYLPPPKDFLSTAFLISKKGTIIHYEDLLNIDKDKIDGEIDNCMNFVSSKAKEAGFKIKLIKANFVKNYKPHIGHYVLDIEVL